MRPNETGQVGKVSCFKVDQLLVVVAHARLQRPWLAAGDFIKTDKESRFEIGVHNEIKREVFVLEASGIGN